MPRAILGVLAGALLVGATLLETPVASAAQPRLQLPDLRMAKPRDVRLVREHGRRLLRFTTTIVNEGRGPMDVVGKRTCRSTTRCPTMRVRQRIRRADGTWEVRPTSARMQYEVGDGHRHWHLVDFEQYRLYRLGVADATARVGAKFGFCFFDVARIRPFGPTGRRYLEPDCGTPSSLKVHVGLSGGWSDVYPWDFAGQYVDVTGLPRGEYLLCVTADPARSLRQVTTSNDQAWVRLRIGPSGIVVRQVRRSSCAGERRRWAPPAGASATRLARAASVVAPTTMAVPRVGLLCPIGA
jgi:hypothetical protein